MANKIVKLTDEQLASIKLRDITNVVKSKFTAEETEQLKTTTDEATRRELITSLYKKYIDEVIAESDAAIAEEEAKKAEEAAAEAKKAEEAKKAAEKPTANAPTKGPKDLNLSISYTVDIRGVPGFNGTLTVSTEQLLLLVFRNPNASVKFKTPERARGFVNAIKNVSHVKGILVISEETRVRAANKIKVVNGL